MEAFPPDLFSDPVPRFSPADPGDARRLLEMLHEAYPHIGPFGTVERCGEIGINSRNYRVRAATKSIIVKETTTGIQEVAAVTSFAELARVSGAPLPRIHADAASQLTRVWGDSAWYVMDDAAGSYFSGDPAELPELAALFAALWELRELAPEEWPARTLPLLGVEDLVTAQLFDERLEEASLLLGEAEAADLVLNWTDLRRMLEDAVSRLADDPLAWGPMHVDLHPHNVMIADSNAGAVALDLDSLRTCATGVALSFGLFKMLRQVASCSGSAAAGRGASAAIMTQIRDVPPCPAALAESEILRRIMLILRLALGGDRRWAHFLPLQLRSLDEVRKVLPS